MFAVAVLIQRRVREGTQTSSLVGLGSRSSAFSMNILAPVYVPPIRSLSSCGNVARTSRVCLLHPCTVTVPTMLMMRNAPSMPSGNRRSTLLCARVGVAANSAATVRPANLLAATCHLGRAAQQIDLLPIVRRQHVDQNFVGGITSECISRLQNCLVDRAQTRLELRDSLRREHRLLPIEYILQRFNRAQVVVLLDRKRGEAGGSGSPGCGNVSSSRRPRV